MSDRTRASTLLLIAGFVLLWNSGFIGAEVGVEYARPFTLLTWRYLALTLLLGVYLLARGRLVWPGWRVAGHVGLVGVLAHGVWLGCVLLAQARDVPPGIVALVVALQPLTTGAFSGWATGERTRPLQWVGLALGFAGVALVVGVRIGADAPGTAFGYLIPFGSVVAITIASLLQRKRELNAEAVRLPVDAQLFYQAAATLVAVAIPAVFWEGMAAEWTPPFVRAMIWLILVVSLGAYGLMWLLLERMSATRVASLFYLGPPVTMVMAWIGFGDRVTPMDVAGMAVVAVGVLLVQRGNGPRHRSTRGAG